MQIIGFQPYKSIRQRQSSLFVFVYDFLTKLYFFHTIFEMFQPPLIIFTELQERIKFKIICYINFTL